MVRACLPAASHGDSGGAATGRPVPLAVDGRRFRSVMGRFTTGITVVSTEGPDGAHCMTANAFMSVSLDPPLVLVSLGVNTKMHDLLQRGGVYGVSVLAADQEPVSRYFSGRPDSSAGVRFIYASGVAVMEGALAHVVARVVDEHPAGDHTLFIGEILELDDSPGDPLVFHAGGYRHLLTPSTDTSYSDAWSGFCLNPMDSSFYLDS